MKTCTPYLTHGQQFQQNHPVQVRHGNWIYTEDGCCREASSHGVLREPAEGTLENLKNQVVYRQAMQRQLAVAFNERKQEMLADPQAGMKPEYAEELSALARGVKRAILATNEVEREYKAAQLAGRGMTLADVERMEREAAEMKQRETDGRETLKRIEV